MKLFLFQRIEQVSGNYHPEGGLVIVASDIDEAMELIAKDENITVTGEDWGRVVTYPLSSDFGYMPFVYVFPDAGCC